MNIQTIAAYALSAGADTKYKAFSSEAFAKAAEVTLMGMGLVFIVLAVLWFVLYIFKLIFAKNTVSDKKEKTADVKAEVTPIPVSPAATATATCAVNGVILPKALL